MTTQHQPVRLMGPDPEYVFDHRFVKESVEVEDAPVYLFKIKFTYNDDLHYSETMKNHNSDDSMFDKMMQSRQRAERYFKTRIELRLSKDKENPRIAWIEEE